MSHKNNAFIGVDKRFSKSGVYGLRKHRQERSLGNFKSVIHEQAAFASTLSASLDGTNDSILISSTPTYVTQSAAFSLSFWMNPEGYGSNGTYANVLALKSDFNSKNFAVHINNNTSGYAGISFGITDYSTNTAYYHTTGVTGNSLLNTWSHVVITYNGSGLGTIGNWKLYIDGDSKTIGAGGGWFDSGGLINTVGNYRDYHYDGKIDELAVFSSLLSASNVTSIYNNGVPANLTSYSPLGWWRMGENDSGSSGATIGTVTDQGSGGNNATGTNGPTYSDSVPTFASTLSADLDGIDDYLDIGSSGDMGSFSLWFKPDSTITTGTTGQYLLSFTANTSAFGNLGLGSSTGSFADEVLTFNQGNRAYGYTGSGLTINTDWHHVAGRWTGSTYEIYLDGNQVKNAEGGSGTAGQVAFSLLKIGGRGASSLFAGLIDEVAVFTNPLSASEIVAIYNSGVPADLTSYSPLGWWRMGENDSGSNGATIGTVTDQGSGGNNATGTNGPTYSDTVPS